MEEKYINFYKMFDKRFKNNKKSYSLFENTQSPWSNSLVHSFLKRYKQRVVIFIYSEIIES